MSQVLPHLFVIFGATGDLAHRMLLPALFGLVRSHHLADSCYVFGAAREDHSVGAFRESVQKTLTGEPHGFDAADVEAWVATRVFYYGLGKGDQDYAGLAQRLEKLEAEHELAGNRVYYLSTPPAAYEATIRGLGEQGLNRSGGWTRLVVEKPFGHDLDSARELNQLVGAYFEAGHVYRIDHFLGKETVQNLLAFRFANLLFESGWSRDRIERVEITAAETLGLAHRAAYYERAGALRDMIQNHLTQLFSLVAMEAPSSLTAAAIQREKIKVLESVQPLDPDADVIFGQYTAGEVDGKYVPGYDDEEGIQGDSDTETFAALRLRVNNWRWDGVPFYLRTGKRMAETLTQVAVRFRCAPASLFQPYQSTCGVSPNALLITLKPEEGFDLCFQVKTPGEPLRLKTERFRFRYADAFGHDLPDPYETLLLDVMQGDQTLFVQDGEAEAAWGLYMPALENRPEVHRYAAGSWGPEASRRLLGGWLAGGTP
jgi:glucose-6-phosphate 1-dehydrogenase